MLTENFKSRAMDLFHPVWGVRFQRSRTALYEWPFKFIFSSDGHHELYNLDIDPGEQRNLAASDLERTAQMVERVETWREHAVRYPKVPPSATRRDGGRKANARSAWLSVGRSGRASMCRLIA